METETMVDTEITNPPVAAEPVDPAAVAPPVDASAPTPEDIPEGELDPTIDAPASLNAEGKAMFAQLPPEAQQWWKDTETTRARQVTEATMRAAEREKSAQSEVARVAAEHKAAYAQQLNTFLSANQPQQPDPSHYNDMQAFARDNAIYQHQMGQFQQLVQQVQGISADAQQGMDAVSQQQMQSEQQKLRTALPDWFDAEKGPKLREELTAVAAAYGYAPERMAHADADDIKALYEAAKDRRDASKYRDMMKVRMAQVRAGKNPPSPMARGVSPNGAAGQAPTNVAAALYPDDVRK